MSGALLAFLARKGYGYVPTSRRGKVALAISLSIMLLTMGAAVALLLILVVWAEPLVTVHRVNLSDPLAVCNDGSPGAYFYHEGGEDAPWMVHLEGGHWCWDQESCADRFESSPGLMSSKPWGESFDVGGIYAARSGPFQDAHVAYVAYCSSDGHMGNRAASEESFGWHFRGRAIVEATLRELVRRGLGSPGRSNRLLFAGCSAGSRGAMSTLDFVRDFLRGEGVDVEVQGLLDAPLWIDMDPFNSQVVSLMDQTRGVLQLANASGRISEDCRSAYPGEEWKCLFAEYRLPFLRTPHLMSFNQYDEWQIQWNLGWTSPPSWSLAEIEYVEAWRKRVLAFVSSSPVPAGSLYFSTACNIHCISTWWAAQEAYEVPTSRSGKFGGDRVSLLEATSAWWEGWLPLRGRLVDDCLGLDCGCKGPPHARTDASGTPSLKAMRLCLLLLGSLLWRVHLV